MGGQKYRGGGDCWVDRNIGGTDKRNKGQFYEIEIYTLSAE